MMLSFVSSFHFLLFLFQFQQHIFQFLQDLKSTEESLWLALKPHKVPWHASAAFGEGTLGLRPNCTVRLLLQENRLCAPDAGTVGACL